MLPKFSPPCTSSPDYLSPQKSHSTSRVSVAHSDTSSSHNTFQVSGTGAGDSLNRPKTLPLTDTTHTNTPRRSQQYQKQNIYAAGEVNAHGFSPGNMSHHGTPPQSTTNYDKDVAVYKQQDPLSQVSSSTDSGYGHAHQFDRNSASDTTSRLSGLSVFIFKLCSYFPSIEYFTSQPKLDFFLYIKLLQLLPIYFKSDFTGNVCVHWQSGYSY